LGSGHYSPFSFFTTGNSSIGGGRVHTEITPTFQRGIKNKWYEVSPKTFYFPNVDIKKFFLL
jgi:hypothetical protein